MFTRTMPVPQPLALLNDEKPLNVHCQTEYKKIKNKKKTPLSGMTEGLEQKEKVRLVWVTWEYVSKTKQIGPTRWFGW